MSKQTMEMLVTSKIRDRAYDYVRMQRLVPIGTHEPQAELTIGPLWPGDSQHLQVNQRYTVTVELKDS